MVLIDKRKSRVKVPKNGVNSKFVLGLEFPRIGGVQELVVSI
jgi:hypothetical protein